MMRCPLPIFLILATAVLPAQTSSTSTSLRQDFSRRLVSAAIERTTHSVRYEPAYVRIPYPGGDVPAETGVCTDEIIRSYRAVGVDLQKEVHEDMVKNFSPILGSGGGCRGNLTATSTTGEYRT